MKYVSNSEAETQKLGYELAKELKKGDVIIEVNGTKIKSVAHFRFVLYKYSVGDTITVKYNRNGKENEVKIKLTKSID